ncbi:MULTISPECIES: tyrosine-type recombinase/integrase [Massilia]|uniref:tyrosine-type recombinase/integrase n=1 Tax=Massilia TaxID=149698 RepID=UPI002796BF13|nr:MULTISPECIES: site-specific integrase [unclassified Massilia]MDQ1835337.1 site-specific integrase [Massilia sp. CCM 9029]MDQ1924633.1 site-specific integrase [Massilia sp. CCM 9206]
MFWIRVHGKQLADVRYEDLLAFAAFITDPQPADQWIATTRFARADPRWRPFCGPLADVSQLQALTVIKSLFRWACTAEYLQANPAQLLTGMRAVGSEAIERHLPPTAISLLLEAADVLQDATPGAALRRARARFLVQAYYLTAVRLNELIGADMRSIRRDDSGAWWLHVLGKGSRRGKVPVPPSLLAEFRQYRQAFGLAALPAPGETISLVLASRGPQRGVSHYAVAAALKAVISRAHALALDAGMPEIAVRLARASTHWLRHSSLTHQANGGVPLKTVQHNARHASIKTTGRYLHKDDVERHAETVAAMTIHPSSRN